MNPQPASFMGLSASTATWLGAHIVLGVILVGIAQVRGLAPVAAGLAVLIAGTEYAVHNAEILAAVSNLSGGALFSGAASTAASPAQLASYTVKVGGGTGGTPATGTANQPAAGATFA